MARSARARAGKEARPKPVPASDSELGFDLVSQLTYMAALSQASVSRDVVFERSGRQGFKTSGSFLHVFYLVKRIGVEYSTALQRVARATRSALMKSIMLRFAASFSSGEPTEQFLAGEYDVEMERYQENYESGVEGLRKWGDAYAALLVSSTLIVVVAMISTMITDLGSRFNIMLTMGMIGSTVMGAWLIYKAPPREVSHYTSKTWTPPYLRWYIRLLMFVGIPGVLLGLILGLSGEFALGMLLAGLALIPAGVLAWLHDRRIETLDADVPSVVRAVGATASALGSTATVALARLDKRSLGALEPYIQRLHGRLANHISPERCWERFAAETGSELTRRTFGAFVDAIAHGAPAAPVSSTCGRFSLAVVLLRAKRRMAANTLAFLVIPLHATMTALLLFILQIVLMFNQKVQEVISEVGNEAFSSTANYTGTLPYFVPKDVSQLQVITGLVLLVLTVANGLVPGFALGGHPMKAALFLGIAGAISGLNLLLVPMISGALIPIE